MLVEIRVFKILNSQCHKGCCEEHSNWVLESEMKFFLSCSLMFLEISDVVEDEAHNKFIEADDWYYR